MNRTRLHLLVLLAALSLGPPLPAQEVHEEPESAAQEEAAAQEPGRAGPEADGEDPAEETEAAAVNPCEIPPDPDEEWIDRMRRGVFETVCGSARWFDQFFGDRRFDAEARRTHGRLRVLAVYDEFEGIDGKLRLRAHVNLPNLDERVNAFLGREDEEDFFRESTEEFGDFLPDFFRDADDQEWLLGLGYSPVGTARQKFDIDGGVKVRSPLEPFVRGRYRHYWLLADENLVRFRETVYWRNQRGFGNTMSLDLERVVGADKLLRLETQGTVDQSTEGMEWQAAVILYQAIDDDRALAYRFAWDGETDHPVPLRRFGPQVTYRQRMFREWLFGEVVLGLTWPREERHQEREESFGVGFGVEIRFGEESR